MRPASSGACVILTPMPAAKASRACRGAAMAVDCVFQSDGGDHLKRTIVACAIAVAMGNLSGFQDSRAQTERELIAMERAAMDGWLKGDPGPMLAAADADITFFHAMTPQRLEGVAAVKELYAAYGGRPLYDSYRIDNPKVQAAGDMAVLTYQLVTRNGDVARTWNATQVYQRKSAGWKVIHTHFSAAAPAQP